MSSSRPVTSSASDDARRSHSTRPDKGNARTAKASTSAMTSENSAALIVPHPAPADDAIRSPTSVAHEGIGGKPLADQDQAPTDRPTDQAPVGMAGRLGLPDQLCDAQLTLPAVID
jgi:hypothetical protein